MGHNALLLSFGSHMVMHQMYVIGFFALAWLLHRRRIYIHA